MKNIKYLVIILLILLIVAIIGLVLIKLNWKDSSNTQYAVNAVSNIISTEAEYEPKEDIFFTVESCIQTYYKYIYSEYEGTNFDTMVEGITNEEDKKKAILSVLDSDYTKNNDINTNNVLSLGENIKTYVKYAGTDYKWVTGGRIDTYAMVGKLYENMKEIATQAYVVRIDKINKTFSVTPQQENNIEQIEINSNEIPIEINKFNTCKYEELSNEELATKYFADYKRKIIGNTTEAFNMLDSEYREKKFSNIEEFEQYLQDRSIQSAFLKSYQVKEYDNYKQYICLDQFNNYYIFNVTDVMKYRVLLDIYTVDLQEFLEQYNKGNDAEKAGLNLQKVFDALNNKDYEFIYNKLDATFKANNFENLNEFEKYIKENFYNSNEVTFSNYRSNADLHIFDATIKEKDNYKSQSIKKTFILKLQSGTDFVMSFNV